VAAQTALTSELPACVIPVGGTNIQARTTAGAFGDVVKALRQGSDGSDWGSCSKPPEKLGPGTGSSIVKITLKLPRYTVFSHQLCPWCVYRYTFLPNFASTNRKSPSKPVVHRTGGGRPERTAICIFCSAHA
jgi:hypothetical protein